MKSLSACLFSLLLVGCPPSVDFDGTKSVDKTQFYEKLNQIRNCPSDNISIALNLPTNYVTQFPIPATIQIVSDYPNTRLVGPKDDIVYVYALIFGLDTNLERKSQ